MSQEPETILQKSLDAVDRHRRRMFITVVVVGLLTMVAYLRLGQVFRAGDGDVPHMLQLSVVTLIFWMSSLAFVIVLQLTVMTKRILRAIELASKSVD
jgi:hypothetical protein